MVKPFYMPRQQLGRGAMAVAARAEPYSWDFAETEDPISNAGLWRANGAGVRTRVVTASGNAIGTQAGGGTFDDSYAELIMGRNGAKFGPHTMITSQIHKGSTTGILEIEHLHRVVSTPGSARCYEPHLAHDGDYWNIVKWLGPNNDIDDFEFIVPHGTYGLPSVSNGWWMRTAVFGFPIVTLQGWINRNDGNGFVQIFSVQDTGSETPVIATGNPGVGFYRESGASAASTFGLSSIEIVNLTSTGQVAP